tara:strand:- start:4994 stop:5227 length:234 start_codon:yes stop_codon:yes gene_type:complete
MHSSPTASDTSARLGRAASGCGSGGQQLARAVHGSELQVKEPAKGKEARVSELSAIGSTDVCRPAVLFQAPQSRTSG